MADNTVNYQINVTRTGEGATAAVADFKAVSAAASQSAAAINTTTPAVANATNATAAAGKQFQVFKGTLTLVAGQAFPQLTASVMVAKNAIDAMRASNTQMTMGLATVGAGVAGLTAMIVTAALAWANYNAEKQQATAQGNLDWQEADIQKRLIAQINQLETENELTKAEARALRRRTGDSGGNQAVGEFIQRRNEGSATEILGRFQQLRDLAESVRALENFGRATTGASKNADAERAMKEYSDDLQSINQMQKDGMLTRQQADVLADQMAIKQNNQLLQIKAQLTEVQALGQSVAQQFASGFSNAFVSFLDGTKSAKEAFTDFARQFLSNVAQMILQTMILNAIKNSSFGGVLGLAKGGVVMAANGVSGVMNVSSPTYFPKFNTIAGEAGSEMLTVLARPRMMEVGGMQAVIGNAGSQKLAITNADELARRGAGAGGMIVVQVQGTPDFEARVVSNSVKGAVVQVANDMRQDSPIARGVKGLTA
jgi:hypothetical protein